MKKFIFALIVTCLGTLILSLNTKQHYPPKPDTPIVAVAEAPVAPIEPAPAITSIEPAVAIVEPVEQPAVETPAPTGDCASEIAKYDWDYNVAHAVMIAESGARSWIVNDNPATKDYSIGCFQINIYGANARTRPSEAELKDPATNVAFAYRLYTGNGQSFIGQWGVCRKIYCY